MIGSCIAGKYVSSTVRSIGRQSGLTVAETNARARKVWDSTVGAEPERNGPATAEHCGLDPLPLHSRNRSVLHQVSSRPTVGNTGVLFPFLYKSSCLHGSSSNRDFHRYSRVRVRDV